MSADALLFEEGERGPDEEHRLQFEALTGFRSEEKKVAKAVLESLILKHEADRWAKASGAKRRTADDMPTCNDEPGRRPGSKS